MSKRAILGDNTTRDCSEACSSTRLRLVQLQASAPVTPGIITQIAHLSMLLIILIVPGYYSQNSLYTLRYAHR